MGLISYGKTDIGLKRKTNQDNLYLGQKQNLFVVADGMGGHNGGDIASGMVREYFLNATIQNDVSPSDFLAAQLKSINGEVKAKSLTDPLLSGMGTTLVCTYFNGRHVYVGNVGDSRCYLFHKQKIYQLTRDHSLVQDKLTYGIYNREEAALDPQKNVLVRTIGYEDDMEPDIFTYQVHLGDAFLLCSDGLHGKVSDEDLIFLFNQMIPKPENAKADEVAKLVDRYILEANNNGGNDNITAILIIAQ